MKSRAEVDTPSNHQPPLWGEQDQAGSVTASVPEIDAPWLDIWKFALTYNGYDRHGGMEGVAPIANTARHTWDQDGLLPDSLDTSRTALFFEQRRYHHFGNDPTGKDAHYIRALLGQIAELSGGVVTGAHDPYP